jgi:hypothetical protein
MSYDEVQRVEHSLDGRGPERVVADVFASGLLAAVDRLIVLEHGSPPYLVTLGVPHQAPPGVERICEGRLGTDGRPSPREADENAALYALAAFTALARRGLPARLVVMAHPTTHDPNKVLDSPYCREIFSTDTRLLFECHGARRERLLDLELSAGRNELSNPLGFGQALGRALGWRYAIGLQAAPGERRAQVFLPGGRSREGSLELPALCTASLVSAGEHGIPALHLEARPRFRRLAPNAAAPCADALALGEAIAASVESVSW